MSVPRKMGNFLLSTDGIVSYWESTVYILVADDLIKVLLMLKLIKNIKNLRGMVAI